MLISNWSQHIYISVMQQNEKFGPGKSFIVQTQQRQYRIYNPFLELTTRSIRPNLKYSMTSKNQSHAITIQHDLGGILFQSDINGTTRVKIIFHENLGKCGSWEFHGVPRFYIGIFTNGYGVYKVYISNTRLEQLVDMAEIFPKST